MRKALKGSILDPRSNKKASPSWPTDRILPLSNRMNFYSPPLFRGKQLLQLAAVDPPARNLNSHLPIESNKRASSRPRVAPSSSSGR